VTIRAIIGVLALDVTLAAVGTCLLWGIGVARALRSMFRLAGLAWLTGAAAMGIMLSLELMVGVPYRLLTALTTGVVLAAIGIAVGRAKHRGVALRIGPLPRLTLIAALGAGVAGLVLEAQFRAARLQPVYEFDAMDFWLSKAKAVYYFGQLKPSLLAQLPNSYYPPLMPVLDAVSFSFMGSADTVTLNLLYWSALAAFVAAAAGLLMPRVPALIMWPTLLALVSVPVIVNRGVAPLSDLPLDYLVATAALLLALWLVEDDSGLLVLAAGLLGAAAITKREGLLFGWCLLASAMAANWSKKRATWPMLLAAAVPGAALTFAWRIWLSQVGVRYESPELGYFGVFTHLGRVWPSLHLTIHVLFGGSLWELVPVILVVGIVVALATRTGKLATFSAAYVVLAGLACSWATLSFPSLPFSTDDSLNPIVRLTGALVIPATAVLPLLLAATWDGGDPSRKQS
jgi:hypothetical protein